jgi:serine O-acetyltransferase
VTTHRVAHALWKEGGWGKEGGAAQEAAALFLQARVAELFAVDIHPAAQIGAGVMLVHGATI